MLAWAERWLGLFEDGTAATSRRMGQGRAWHRSGRVTDVRIGHGQVSGSVQGNRATPYLVTITVARLDDAGWERTVTVLAGQVGLTARLLAGQVPEALGDELAAVGVRLFPSPEDVHGRCDCGDTAENCAHVQAVAYAVAERLLADPFALLRLRGRGRERLIAALQGARRTDSGPSSRMPVTELDPDTFTSPPRDLALPRLSAEAQGPTLTSLDNPPGWPAAGPQAPELFRPLVRAAADWLREATRE